MAEEFPAEDRLRTLSPPLQISPSRFNAIRPQSPLLFLVLDLIHGLSVLGSNDTCWLGSLSKLLGGEPGPQQVLASQVSRKRPFVDTAERGSEDRPDHQGRNQARAARSYGCANRTGLHGEDADFRERTGSAVEVSL